MSTETILFKNLSTNNQGQDKRISSDFSTAHYSSKILLLTTHGNMTSMFKIVKSVGPIHFGQFCDNIIQLGDDVGWNLHINLVLSTCLSFTIKLGKPVAFSAIRIQTATV